MNVKPRNIVIIAFAGSVLASGIAYWLTPYGTGSFPSDLFGPGLFVVVLLATLARVFGRLGFWLTTFVIGAAVPTAVFARVVVEVAIDSGKHNLWPLELILAAGPGLMAAFVGAAIGSVYVRWSAA